MGAFALGMAMAELALKYGIPLAIQLASLWSADVGHDPTPEDFEALRKMVPDPETYFPAGALTQ